MAAVWCLINVDVMLNFGYFHEFRLVSVGKRMWMFNVELILTLNTDYYTWVGTMRQIEPGFTNINSASFLPVHTLMKQSSAGRESSEHDTA